MALMKPLSCQRSIWWLTMSWRPLCPQNAWPHSFSRLCDPWPHISDSAAPHSAKAPGKDSNIYRAPCSLQSVARSCWRAWPTSLSCPDFSCGFRTPWTFFWGVAKSLAWCVFSWFASAFFVAGISSSDWSEMLFTGENIKRRQAVNVVDVGYM